MGFFSSAWKGVKKIGSSIASSAGDLVGAALGTAGSIYASERTAGSAADANQLTKESYQNRYQWTMDDMRKAGMNPIYAYSSGVGGAGGYQAATYQNPFSGAATGINSSLAMKKFKNENDLLAANANSARSQAKMNNSMYTNLQQKARISPEFFDAVLAEQQANSETARAMADLAKVQKNVQGRDARFWLNHPNLRNFKNTLDAFNNVLPNTGILINPLKGGKR